MSFFEDFPDPADAEPEPFPAPTPRAPWEQPVYVLPGSVPGDTVLLHTELAAVSIGGVRAYPNGFAFHLRAVLRRDPAVGPWLGDPLRHQHNALRPRDPQSNLRLGMRYADGRQVGNRGGISAPWGRDDDPRVLRLQSDGGHGSGLTWDSRFWTSPLPPDGPVTLYASWLDAGVREVSAELDGTAIRAAGARAVRLWPSDEEPEDPDGWSSLTASVTSPGANTSTARAGTADPEEPADPETPGE